jgi:hypothetical protein
MCNKKGEVKMKEDRLTSCEPNYKDECNMLREKCKQLAYENEKLKEALIKVVLKLS